MVVANPVHVTCLMYGALERIVASVITLSYQSLRQLLCVALIEKRKDRITVQRLPFVAVTTGKEISHPYSQTKPIVLTMPHPAANS